MSTPPTRTIEESAEELARFFRGLSPRDRGEYEALARLDAEFGEDVVAEQRERARGARS